MNLGVERLTGQMVFLQVIESSPISSGVVILCVKECCLVICS